MLIIKTAADEYASRPPIQTWQGAAPPEGYAEVACGTNVFYEFCGFVELDIEGARCVGMRGNAEAYAAYIAALPEEEENEPVYDTETDLLSMMVDHEYRITLIELGVM